MTTYTPIWRLATIVPFDPAVKNSWGSIQDSTMNLMEQGAVGQISVDLTGLSTYSLTTANNASDQARYMVQTYIGALTGGCTVMVPNISRIGWARNSTTGGQVVTISAGAGTMATLPADGLLYFISMDGATNVSVIQIGLGATAVNGALTVNGDATFNGATSVEALAINGNITSIGGTNTFSGASSFESVSATSLTLTGNLVSTGGANSFTGNTGFSQEVTINGATSPLNVPNGPSTFNTIQTNGNLTSSFGGGWVLNGSGLNLIGGATVGFGGVFSGGNVLAVGYYATSDVRVKSDLQSISPMVGADFVRTRKPYTYTKAGRREAGLIAQDLVRDGYGEYVAVTPSPGLPEIVRDGIRYKADHELSINPDNTIAYMIAAIQALQAEVEELKRGR